MKAEELAPTVDVYSRVTSEIIKAIEAGASEFRMPWHQRGGAGLPRNAATGNFYRGVNTVALWSAASLRGYFLPYWASYRQWSKLGAQVRRNQRSAVIVFYKREVPGADGQQDEGKSEGKQEGKSFLRYSPVFNAEQVDGWPYPEPQGEDRTKRLEKSDAFISAIGAEIRYGSEMAYYSPRVDRIHMPDRRQFVETATSTETEGFYSVLLHEHVHWSGHPRRLSRDLSGRFGSSAYAMEELIAELGAAFLCADLGISVHPRKDHAAYVASWLVVLRQQKSAIFTAASAATLACQFLADLSKERQTSAMLATS